MGTFTWLDECRAAAREAEFVLALEEAAEIRQQALLDAYIEAEDAKWGLTYDVRLDPISPDFDRTSW